MSDEINNPAHYRLFPDMEAIDVIQRTLTPEEFKGYLKGNALKYRLRAGDKGPAEKCLGKANWYQGRLRSMSVHRSHPATPNVWDEVRADVIGQNGNDGEHYTRSDDDGWIEWHGGECPADEDARVDVIRRGGLNGSGRVGNFYWEITGESYWDIIRYRLL